MFIARHVVSTYVGRSALIGLLFAGILYQVNGESVSGEQFAIRLIILLSLAALLVWQLILYWRHLPEQ